MITHLVLIDVTQAHDAPFVSEQIHSMLGEVPGLLVLAGGTSAMQLPTTWSLGFAMVFSDADAVRAYQTHPVHLEVAGRIKGMIRQMATCDLAGGHEMLMPMTAVSGKQPEGKRR